MIKVKVTLNVRTPTGKFPPGSFARVLMPAREDLRRDVERAFEREADPVNWRRWPARKVPVPWPPLRKTGRLKEGVLKAVAAAVVRGSTLVVKVQAPPWFAFQQKGTRTIAPRRVAGASLRTLAALRRRLKAEAVRAFRGRS